MDRGILVVEIIGNVTTDKDFGKKMRKGARLAIVGQNTLAQTVTAALGRLQGVGNVRQMAAMPESLAGIDAVIEMVGGVDVAYQVAMKALGSGVACVTSSPMLVAAHGRVLEAAAKGQCTSFGFSASTLGMHVSEFVQAAGVERLCFVPGEGASAMLGRMAYRAESFEQIETDMMRYEQDASDSQGKVTQARAAALYAQWMGEWPKLSAQPRVGLDKMDVRDFRQMREFGLLPVYGAQLNVHGFYTGPLAVASDSLLTVGGAVDVLLCEGSSGESVMMLPASEEARVVKGIISDVSRWLREKGSESRMNEILSAKVEPWVCYVRVPYGRRDALVAQGEVMGEKIEGDGQWQAVIKGVDVARLKLLAPDGCALPVAGAWEMPSAGLRLVG